MADFFFCNIFRRTFSDYFAAMISTFGSHVYNPIRTFYYVKVMLDYEYTITFIN